ncbi:uncharacterized protein LACBIDRAFT_320601 [Laccaria bicolor S238N-H82]|uniref:Predicted protein n=1 Tax=Laccaria bicolor (strain S238N-H82 / ATCC MYA-4686) TaxID=486041 RepID=B0CQK0_LACBS|nr:uncharacterized protein LACBIDRAFT_320601 [Laccaria bicolor S238N-H82]EDR15658.1 predicted protein [Laccaria bicolor S238N-H82]|eukprot:XP_001873866.1 predicted protein [Laccaria bicolor S238N-H82]
MVKPHMTCGNDAQAHAHKPATKPHLYQTYTIPFRISRPSTRLKSNATNPATKNLPNIGITNRNPDYANHIQRGCENDDSNAECPTTPSTTKAASRLGHCPIHSRKSDTNDGSGEFQHKRPRRDTHGRAWDGAPPGGKWWGWEARGSKSRLCCLDLFDPVKKKVKSKGQSRIDQYKCQDKRSNNDIGHGRGTEYASSKWEGMSAEALKSNKHTHAKKYHVGVYI